MVLRRILSFRRNSNRIKNLNKSTRSKSPGLSPGELEEKKFDFETKKRLKRLTKEDDDMLKNEKFEEELDRLSKSMNSPISPSDLEINKLIYTFNQPDVINIDVNGTKYNVGKGKNKKSKRKLRKNIKSKRKNKKTKKK